ncbi:hypothetical protein HAX54_025419 [Datura stramonium]|uniref:Uncharacterized protein n=1 Tax=Datura stramonium TaxID=4076 RepID=A0ABS8V0M2_DATST|nr:hypothetical protein [Datura stramonium]
MVLEGQGKIMKSKMRMKNVTCVTREIVCLVYALMTAMPINVGGIIKDVLRRERVKNWQSISFGGLSTQFLRGHQIEEELRMNGVTEEQLQQLNMDYPLNVHLRALCRVGPGFEETLDDDDATEKE